MKEAAANLSKTVVAFPFYLVGLIAGLVVRLFRLVVGAVVVGLEDGSGRAFRARGE